MSGKAVQELTHPQRVRILYKTILRLHRGLPQELKELGNNYTRDEFRRHLKCKPNEAAIFMEEWANYAVTLTKQLGLKGKAKGSLGETLNIDTVEMLSDEQTVQLYELLKAATGLDENIDEITTTTLVTENPNK